MQSALEITFHPADMARYGKSPTGLPLYRVVWSHSRMQRVFANGKMHVDQMYDYLPATWILEKWQPAEKLLGMTRAEYEALFEGPMFGKAKIPYPEGGDYEYSMHWVGPINEAALHFDIARHEYKMRNKTDAERAAVVEENRAQKLAEVDKKRDAVIEGVFGEYK